MHLWWGMYLVWSFSLYEQFEKLIRKKGLHVFFIDKSCFSLGELFLITKLKSSTRGNLNKSRRNINQLQVMMSLM